MVVIFYGKLLHFHFFFFQIEALMENLLKDMGKLESKLNEERIRQQRVNIEILISKDKNIRINITTCI